VHIFFSGIGGSGIGPLAEIAHQMGYQVSGSDKQASRAIDHLRAIGINGIHIGQSAEQIAAVHAAAPIDWLVYSSAVAFEGVGAPEIEFARANGVRVSKRDELLNEMLGQHRLDMIAVAGTHGKTTTVAMTVWTLLSLGVPVSYLLSAETTFAKMASFDPASRYFVYEADEFDRNFLHFSPGVALISGIGYDHQEIFPTVDDYNAAFHQFIAQTGRTFIWQDDAERLDLGSSPAVTMLPEDTDASVVRLAGRFNRRDAMLVATAVQATTGDPLPRLTDVLSQFPGLGERMEPIAPGLYSNYAHTPEKIVAAIDAALELKRPDQRLVVVYEPLTNRRQHFLQDSYPHVFDGVDRLYWVPTRLAREDPAQPVLTPSDMIARLDDRARAIATPAVIGDALKAAIARHLQDGDIVVAMVAGGAGDGLDHWLRQTFGAVG